MLSDDGADEIDENATYLYLHIEPLEKGGKAEKQIVPATLLKKFDYDEYKQNAAHYKNKKFKIRLHPDGEKQNCYLLLAGDTYEEVNAAVQTKRYGVPNLKFSESVSDDNSILQASTINNQITEEQTRKELLQDSKKARKRKRNETKKQKKGREEAIIEAYLQEEENDLNNGDIIASSPLIQNKAQSDKEVIRSQKKRIKLLEHQLKIARKVAVEINNIRETSNEADDPLPENSRACKENNISNIVSCNSLDVFRVHDKIYHFNKEQDEKEIEYDERGYVHLGQNVYCNPIAYSDSFKSKDPFKCLSILSEGVYGLEDLSKRCVRKQKNTQNKKLLSPVKRLMIERKVYAFMRIKDKPLSQIDDFLNDLNIKHGKVIHGAAKRLEYEKQQKELEDQLNAQIELQMENNNDLTT